MKMETAKMDVVRFTESDVIVASGFETVTGKVAYAGDGVGNTLEVTVSNDHFYDYATLEKGQTDHMQDLGKVKFTVISGDTSATKTIADLFAHNSDNGYFDGDYVSTDGGWEYIRHQ